MFYMKTCKKEQFCFVLLWFFAFFAQKGENTTAGEQEKQKPERSSLQIPGNRS